MTPGTSLSKKDELWLLAAHEALSMRSEDATAADVAKLCAELFADGIGEHSFVYRTELEDEGWSLGIAATARMREDAVDVFRDFLTRRGANRFALYDPLRPEPDQRNVVLGDAELAADNPVAREVYRALGVHTKSQIRCLVCDGPMLLAWVGGFREEPFGPRERRMLERLVDPVRRRLSVERALDASSYGAALDATLDAVSVPAFLVGENHRVLFANEPGVHLLDKARTEAMTRIALATSGVVLEDQAIRVRGRGSATMWLVLLRSQPAERGRRELAAAVQRWKLTRREGEVLALMARGDANKDIATKLACAVATVEIHVTNVLAKARAESRAQVIARFWTGE